MDTAITCSVPQLYYTADGEVRAEEENKVTSHPNNIDGVNNNSNSRVIARLMFVVVGMFGFGFAMVPLYDVFCKVTGFGGRSLQKTESAPARIDDDREITVEFVASVGKHAYMEFRPKVAKIKIRPGQYVQTSFFATNLNRTPITGRAIYNVAPAEGSLYFHKTECFCFNHQPLDGETATEMPLQFIVDQELPKDIRTITLSYTIFDVTEMVGGVAAR